MYCCTSRTPPCTSTTSSSSTWCGGRPASYAAASLPSVRRVRRSEYSALFEQRLKSSRPQADQVVVAGDRGARAAAQQLDAFVGIGVVADDVAEAERAARTPRSSSAREHRLQRLAVAVDVG